MRKLRKVYQAGDIRVEKRFLWFPVTTMTPDKKHWETRWLEYVTIVEKYYSPPFPLSPFWKIIEFKD